MLSAARAALDERLRGRKEPERQSGHQGRRPLAGAVSVDRRTEIEQRVNQRDLQPGLRRVAARDEHAHGRVVSAVHVRERVCLRATLEQPLRHVNGSARGLLPVAFDAVGAHVVEQRGPMPGRVERRDTRRSGVNQIRMLAQKRRQRGDVAVDHGFDGGFKV